MELNSFRISKMSNAINEIQFMKPRQLRVVPRRTEVVFNDRINLNKYKTKIKRNKILKTMTDRYAYNRKNLTKEI